MSDNPENVLLSPFVWEWVKCNKCGTKYYECTPYYSAEGTALKRVAAE